MGNMCKSTNSLYYLGIALCGVINVLIVASRYVCKELKISPLDAILFKGILQIPISLIALWRRRHKSTSKVDIATSDTKKREVDYAFIPPTLQEKIGIVIWGALGGFPSASQYAAVQYIPMGDFTALCSLGPILAYIVARVFLKHKFTILKVSCCLVVIIGVIMVVQPPLIFGVAEGETTKFTSKYLIGLACAGSFLFSVTILVNAPLMYPNVPNDVVMFWMGIGTIVTPFACAPLMGIPVKFLNDTESITWTYGMICAVVGGSGVIQDSSIVPLIRMSGPTTISMVRRTEICLVLVVDYALFSLYPNTIGSIGYILVIVCSFGLIVAPKIEEKLCPTKAIESQVDSQSQDIEKQPDCVKD